MLANLAACSLALGHVALFYPSQDPFLHLRVDPADATVANETDFGKVPSPIYL